MPHSPCRIWVHAIWSTNDPISIFHPAADQVIHKFLDKDFQEMAPTGKTINRFADHTHVQFLLNPQKSLADLLNLAKGSSFHSLNQERLFRPKCSWEINSTPFTIGESLVEQNLHLPETHTERYSKKSFLSKYQEILKIHGLEMEI